MPAGLAGAAWDGGAPGQTAQRPVRDGAAAEVQRGEGGQVAGHRGHHRVLHQQTRILYFYTIQISLIKTVIYNRSVFLPLSAKNCEAIKINL